MVRYLLTFPTVEVNEMKNHDVTTVPRCQEFRSLQIDKVLYTVR